MSWYENVVMNRIIERVLGTRPIEAQRRHVLAGVTGDVLEIGTGTGLNMAAMPPAVRALTAVTRDPELHPLAARRASKHGVSVAHISGSADALPCADASFDSVVTTFLFCSLTKPEAVARECARVLRNDGQLFFLEHVVAERGGRRIAQQILDLPSRALLCGCSLVRDTPAVLQQAGFELVTVDYVEVPTMPITHRYLARGVARKRSKIREMA